MIKMFPVSHSVMLYATPILIILATIGFSLTLLLFDRPITRIAGEIDTMNSHYDSAWQSSLRAVALYNSGRDIRDHRNILESVGAENRIVEGIKQDITNNIRSAISTLTV